MYRGEKDENSLYEFYNALKIFFNEEPSYGFKPIVSDQLLKLILMNNGCSFKPEAEYYTKQIITDYYVIIIKYAMGNSINEFFDYIEAYGAKNLVIFMDYFDNYIDNNFNDPLNILGKSVYFDAFKKLTDVFIETTTSTAEIMGSLTNTCAAANYRYAGLFIAASLINDKYGLQEEDQSLIPYNEIMNILNNIDIKLLLLGIKHLEE